MDKSTEIQEPLTFYAGKDGMTVIVCPACGLSKEVNVFKTDIARKKTKARCKCKHTFEFIVEIRTLYRKKVTLKGQCEHIKSGKRDVIQIKDLSMNGIGFEHPSPIDIAIGDRLKVALRLDNELNSKINLRVEVTRMQGHFIGARSIGPGNDPTLGFYLQS